MSFFIMEPDEKDIKRLSRSLNVSPLVCRILLNRGISKEEEARLFLFGTYKDMLDPMLIGGMKEGVDLILSHIKRGSLILIHGDYDADGVTSTAIMVKGLSRIGARTLYYIPDRFDEGYGFSEGAVSVAKDKGVGLIVTVDCGSSNYENVKSAKDAGIDVIITDHHEVPEVHPPANVFINLKKKDETFPFKELSGAGVSLYLIRALYEKLGRSDWRDFLDLAAIGTVADVVPLVGENRLLVKEGLSLLSQRKRAGVFHLLDLAKIKRENLSPWDISFIIAPKINAAGRLSDATLALECLLEEDWDRARQLAESLVRMNEERQVIENEIKAEIEKIINENPQLLSVPVWVFSGVGWHQGVIGIVAARFSQSFKKPVFLISIGEDGIGRGSARCGENYSVYKALDGAKDLLIHYGGHQMAGGFTIPKENIDKFRDIVSRKEFFTDVYKITKVDAELGGKDINLERAREIQILSPFGEGNPKPLFYSREVYLHTVVPVGSENKHLKVWASIDGVGVKGIAFGKGDYAASIFNKDLLYDLLYHLDVDFWNDVEEVSLKIQEIIQPDRESERIITGLEEVSIGIPSCNYPKVVDARRVIDKRKYIKNLYRAGKRILVFTRNRRQLEILQENLRQEGVPLHALNGNFSKNERLFAVPYDQWSFPLDFHEAIFYHPPYRWVHFARLGKVPSLQRIHFLFCRRDVYREEANQDVLSPNEDKLRRIYEVLKALAYGKKGFAIPQEIADKIEDPRVNQITVLIAFKIFSELGIVDYKEDKGGIVFNLKGDVADIDRSVTYRSLVKRRQAYFQMKSFFLSPILGNISKEIVKIIKQGG